MNTNKRGSYNPQNKESEKVENNNKLVYFFIFAIIIFVVLLLFIFLFYFLGNSHPSENNNSKETSGFQQNSSDKGIKNEITSCLNKDKEIFNPNNEEECYNLFTSPNIIEKCSDIEESKRDYCVYVSALNQGFEGYCDKIKNKSIRQECFMETSVDTFEENEL
ncbi:MAG: hypothetical protein ACOCP4_06395 [Candidatus Woesearchaeota archaeon]